jgi:hypothetical protein
MVYMATSIRLVAADLQARTEGHFEPGQYTVRYSSATQTASSAPSGQANDGREAREGIRAIAESLLANPAGEVK